MSQTSDNGEKKNANDDDNALEISRRDIPVIKDSDPVIIDEVFEEYIRERYSEALLNENGDDYFEKTYKLDKLLSKNLMSELKEALIDKQNDTRQRESRALKRMNRDPQEETAKDNALNDGPALDLAGSGIESGDLKLQSELESTNGDLRDEAGTEKLKLNCVPMPPPPPMPKEFNQLKKELGKGEENENQQPKYFVPLPSSSSIQLPLFLSNNEETFIGSGENSDEEADGQSEMEEEEGEEEEEIPNS